MLNLNIIDATGELRLLRFLDEYTPPFDLVGTYRLIDDGVRPEATVTLRAGDQEMHEADLGVGPVDALANVLKKSLGQLFPGIPKVRLLDFKVRLIEGHIGTSSQIEVSIIFSDGDALWRAVSVDDNVNLASFKTLLDGYEYAIYLWGKKTDAPRTRGRGDTETRGKKTASSRSGGGGEGTRGRKPTAAPGKRGVGETAKRGKTGVAKTTAKTKPKAPVKPKAKSKKK